MAAPAASDRLSHARDPLTRFRAWFQQARRRLRSQLPEAMCVSTVNRRGFPTARMMLLKDCDRRGFTFYTNIHSPKARNLLDRRKAALTFYWPVLGRQVRIEGAAARVPKREADAYFATRPRLSQIGSWASKQSAPLASRAVLIRRVKQLEAKYRGKKVPPPPHWQGFCVRPLRIEFWQERPNRLHDRWLYQREQGKGWQVRRLYP